MIAAVSTKFLQLSMVNANRGATGFKSSEFEEEYDRPSKSQLKRDMIVLQKLGEQLVDEPKERVMRLPLPDDVRNAILECQNIKAHEGRRRQMQFIGKKMRTLKEDEVIAIQKVMDSWRGQSKAQTAVLHALERQRDKLLADDTALTALLVLHPGLDVQQLRTLIRNARKEQAESKPPKAFRELFHILKALQAPGATPTAKADADSDEDDDEQIED